MPETGTGPVLYPVVWKVPAGVRKLAVRARNEFLSRLARRALAASARLGGLRPGRLAKDPDGRPLASNGCYWSLTHKPGFVGAVCAAVEVGIDIERLRPVSPGLYRKLADRREWGLAGGEHTETFFRLWTAKEAAVKATGAGIADLRRCRLRRILDREHLSLDYRGRLWRVAHYYVPEHVASIVEASGEVRWTLRGADETEGEKSDDRR